MVEFGDYAQIEHLTGSRQQIYKVIGTKLSNYWVDVPIKFPAEIVFHGKSCEVALCIHCGVCETEVLKYRISDITRWIP